MRGSRSVFFVAGTLLTAALAADLAAGPPPLPSQDAEADTAPATPDYPIPDNLVIDLRLFESRSTAPDFATMNALNFFVMTDGRDVTALQWPSTLAKQVPDTFLAALVADTAPVKDGVATFEWATGTRSILSEIHLEGYHPAGTFKAQFRARFMRGEEALREHERELDLQIHRTSVWSSDELEISASDYLSHFREFADRESRGRLYALLRPNTFFLILAATPRLLTEEEAQQQARALSRPPGAEPPSLENPTGIPLMGTILVRFELDESGHPVNPQIARSSFPEANLHVIDEVAQWQFPTAAGEPAAGEVAVELEVPASKP